MPSKVYGYPKELWEKTKRDLEDWIIEEDHNYCGISESSTDSFVHRGVLLPTQMAKLCSVSVFDYTTAFELPMRLNFGLFASRSYPTVTLSLAREERNRFSIFSILNQSVTAMASPREMVRNLMPLKAYGPVQTEEGCKARVLRLIKTRHVKARTLVPGDFASYWFLDPYNSSGDGIYRFQYPEIMNTILFTLVGVCASLMRNPVLDQ